MKSYTTREAKAKLGEIVRHCREAPVEVKRFGRTAAVILSPILSPIEFAQYLRFKEIINAETVAAGVMRAVELCAAGDMARGLGVFRALAPYWRKAGIKSAPRKQERRKEQRKERREIAEML
ncbi:MAG: hypothetical protein ABL957_14205 [Parvularculaceae bacterium]